MKEYDLYLPLHYNDGEPVDPEKLTGFRKRLVDQFGGLTHFPQENEGIWKVGGVTFRDRIVILRVLTDDPAGARRFFVDLRIELMRQLEQADVLVVEREVSVVQ